MEGDRMRDELMSTTEHQPVLFSVGDRVLAI